MSDRLLPRDLGPSPIVPVYPQEVAYTTADPDAPEVVIDGYTWLNDQAHPDFAPMATAQNEYTSCYLQQTGVADRIRHDFEAFNQRGDSRGLTQRFGDYQVWVQRDVGDDQSRLLCQKDGDAEPRVVFDPNTETGTAAIQDYFVSTNGSHILCGVNRRESENPAVHIYDTETGDVRPFYEGSFFWAAWDADERGFTYSISHDSDHEDAPRLSYQRVYHHTMGTSREQDKLVFDGLANGFEPTTLIWPKPCGDTNARLIVAKKNKDDVRLFLGMDGQPPQPILADATGRHDAQVVGDMIYVTTDADTAEGKVIAAPLAEAHRPFEDWSTPIPAKPDHYIRSVHHTKESLIVERSHNVASTVAFYDRQSGQYQRMLDLPPFTNLAQLEASTQRSDFTYAIANFLTANDQYYYDGTQSHITWQSPKSLDHDAYELGQEAFQSADGTVIRASTAVAKWALQADMPPPGYQDVYGGFRNGSHPENAFHDFHAMLLRYGFKIIRPHIRGGDEFGGAWHTQAIGPNKPKTFEDAAACGQYFKAQGLVGKLAIAGGSMGGTTAIAAALRAPESYDAVIARSLVANLYNFKQSPTGAHWTHEFGDPDVPEERAWLATWSPHVAEIPAHMPPTYYFAGLNEKRVAPSDTITMAARHQAAAYAGAVLRLDGEGGHGHGRGNARWCWAYSERLAFLVGAMGITLPDTI
jgi:prolyl oligopeptidase